MNENDTKKAEVIKNFSPIKWLVNLLSTISRRTLLDIIIILIPIFLIYIYFNRTPSEIKETLKNNKIIDKKIDSLKIDNGFIVERMFELEKKQTLFFDMMNENNNLIRENNKELQRLKRIYNEKINSINIYSTSQLDSFFKSRYKDYYNN